MTLARHTPLKRTPIKAKPSKPLKRTRMQRRPATPRTREQGGDPAYLVLVRGLSCCLHVLGSCTGAIEAHHHTHGRGMGKKTPDDQAMPLCEKHHRHFHAACGWFKGTDKTFRRAWQTTQVAHTQKQLAGREAEAFPY